MKHNNFDPPDILKESDKDFLVEQNVVVLMLIAWAPNVQGRDRKREADICSTRTKINNQFFISGPQCVNFSNYHQTVSILHSTYIPIYAKMHIKCRNNLIRIYLVNVRAIKCMCTRRLTSQGNQWCNDD